jgi:hypothetical protein
LRERLKEVRGGPVNQSTTTNNMETPLLSSGTVSVSSDDGASSTVQPLSGKKHAHKNQLATLNGVCKCTYSHVSPRFIFCLFFSFFPFHFLD